MSLSSSGSKRYLLMSLTFELKLKELPQALFIFHNLFVNLVAKSVSCYTKRVLFLAKSRRRDRLKKTVYYAGNVLSHPQFRIMTPAWFSERT